MNETLSKIGVPEQNIYLLADGLGGAKLPTLNNIKSAMSQIQSSVKAGDKVVLFLAGHGSQQPQRLDKPTTIVESDGLDEIFLPYDVGQWDASLNSVQNALVDDEIWSWVSSLAAKDVQLWGIFDTCHSGDMIKSIGLNEYAFVKSRYVAPTELNIPEAKLTNKQPSSNKSHKHYNTKDDKKEASQSYIAFYASQSDEPSLEEPMGQDKQMHGIFTYHLIEAMKLIPHGTFRDLGSEVTNIYRQENRPFPTPYYEGRLSISWMSGFLRNR